MLTKLIAALALCLALTITPLTASPAYAEGGCEGASWGVACGVGVPGYGGSGGATSSSCRDWVINSPNHCLKCSG